ncbi:N-acetylmuramoyl-L-alanine amidase [Candidatus Poribacteria bacterium]|nr:N-acetylmuramoyl-L-alanine amidase [Candidatus Poribacteria bacterium]
MNPQYICIHHSLTKDGTVVDWEAIRKYHREVNGWSDIGYHYGIERVGQGTLLQVGRPESQPGAHCKEMHMNSKSIGICVVGNFDLAPPGLEVLRFLSEIVRRKVMEYGIPVQAVLGHREVGAMAGFDWKKGQYKSCPGKYFPMDTLRSLLSGELKFT